ncbi:hypothetical protein PHET_01685 [Paragonimus heterotremus]|uniref:Ion transport domain-containing protein n=1 Tax=Paragonimus heterotremus TaxID=100268 RepID=A0A8J4SNX1_9TREM|nr:hypothetical protein PHET_01685 [Paragonimus heterotremus]
MDHKRESIDGQSIQGLDPKKLERAIAAFPESNLNRTTSVVSLLQPPRKDEREICQYLLEATFNLFVRLNSSRSDSTISANMIDRLRNLRSKFNNRTETIRLQTMQHVESSSSAEEKEDEGTGEGTDASKTEEHELQLTAQLRGPDASRRSVMWWNRHPGRKLVIRQPFCTACLAPHRKHFVRLPDKPCVRIEMSEKTHEEGVSLEDDSHMPYLLWLLTLACAVVYNFVSIPLREAFDIYDNDIFYGRYWQFANSLADVIYLMDILFVKPRIEFLEGGITKFDIISVIPLDLCSLFYEKEMARFRILRLFKVHAFWDTFERLDQRLNAGYAVRLARTMIYMIYIIHLESCGYYSFNRIQGMNATTWSIPSGHISPYVYSFYVCMKTATSIGSLPAATNPYEFMFMTSYWLTGIFVSAILIGQIIDILDSANANKVNYRRIMDATLSCMHHLHAPDHVVDKVRKWFLYNWEQQKTFASILYALGNLITFNRRVTFHQPLGSND